MAAVIQGSHCLPETNLLASLAFHIDVFKSFSTAALFEFTGGVLLVSFLFLYSIHIIRKYAVDFFAPLFSAVFQLFAYTFLFKRRLAYWLALHEHSPTSA